MERSIRPRFWRRAQPADRLEQRLAAALWRRVEPDRHRLRRGEAAARSMSRMDASALARGAPRRSSAASASASPKEPRSLLEVERVGTGHGRLVDASPGGGEIGGGPRRRRGDGQHHRQASASDGSLDGEAELAATASSTELRRQGAPERAFARRGVRHGDEAGASSLSGR